MAKKICIEKSQDMGITAETLPSCTGPMEVYLRQAVDNWMLEKTLELPVTVNGVTFDLRFLPERESPISMARKLCVENANTIGGLTNENIATACVNPVADYVESGVKNWINEKTITVP